MSDQQPNPFPIILLILAAIIICSFTVWLAVG